LWLILNTVDRVLTYVQSLQNIFSVFYLFGEIMLNVIVIKV